MNIEGRTECIHIHAQKEYCMIIGNEKEFDTPTMIAIYIWNIVGSKIANWILMNVEVNSLPEQ